MNRPARWRIYFNWATRQWYEVQSIGPVSLAYTRQPKDLTEEAELAVVIRDILARERSVRDAQIV